MTQEIEIEFKHLLTKDQFEDIRKSRPFSTEPIVQVNYYFETNNQALIHRKCALRIREKNETFTATFKEPHPKGILETHDVLSAEEVNNWITHQVAFTTNVGKRLREHNVPLEAIHYIGALTTERYTYKTNNLLYVLDRSTYGDITDYELEIEAENFADGDFAHKHMIEQYKLPDIEPITKIERFLNAVIHPND